MFSAPQSNLLVTRTHMSESEQKICVRTPNIGYVRNLAHLLSIHMTKIDCQIERIDKIEVDFLDFAVIDVNDLAVDLWVDFVDFPWLRFERYGVDFPSRFIRFSWSIFTIWGSIPRFDSYDSHGRFVGYGGRFPESIYTILRVDSYDVGVDFKIRFIRFFCSIFRIWWSISCDSYDSHGRFVGNCGRFHDSI
jgi:hypothetical protein